MTNHTQPSGEPGGVPKQFKIQNSKFKIGEVDLEELRQQLKNSPIPALQEIIVVKAGKIIEFFP